MVFEIKNKVVLITGGASGIGLSLVKEILRNNAKGVAIADINSDLGVKVREELEQTFGSNRCIFIKTDVSNYKEFQVAFEKTIDQFGNIDILLNNAGIVCGEFWEKEISVNLKGTIHGMLLGYDKFLSKFKQDKEALIVNTSSICGVESTPIDPVYCATKSGIISLVKAYGIPQFYEDMNVRVVGICPGVTTTPLFANLSFHGYGERYQHFAEQSIGNFPTQEPDFVAKETVKIMKHALNGTVWIIEGGEPAYEYILPDRKTMKHNVLSYK